MDKLRLSVSGSHHDFARLYDWNGGFHNETMDIAFPSGQSLTLFLISARDYALSIEGDATLEKDTDVGNEFMRFHTVKWSDEAKLRGTASASVKLVNPEFPDQPLIANLTMGAFSFQSHRRASEAEPLEAKPFDNLGVQAMMAQEAAHAFLGNLA